MATITGIDIDASTTTPILNIGNTNATSINIGTTSANATAIAIGKSGNTTTVNGALTVTQQTTTNGGIKTTNIEPTTVSSTLDIATTQTTTALNIGNGVRTTTGGINIGTGSGTNINPITIGGASSATTNGGTFTSTGLITASNGIKTANLDTIAAGTLSIGTSISNLVNIAKPGINTAILGTLSVAQASTLTGGIKSNSYDINLLNPSELSIGASVTNDIVRIAENVTTGQVLIGHGEGCAGSCYIMNSGSSARTIGIGSASAPSIINLYGTVTTSGISKLVCSSTTFSVGRPGDNAYWISSNNYVNGVYLAGSSGAGWVSVSDITSKENIELLPNMLDKINELKPCQYNYIGNQDEICMGFIAQELQNQFPNLIYKSSDKLGIAYTGLIPVIIKALQEQQVQINSLKDELKLLSAKIV